MRRFLTMACAFGLISLFAAPSYAIDAKKKSGSATSSSAAPADSSRSRSSVKKSKAANSKTLLERLKKDVRESSKSKDSEKYDNYIDKNNDGVDDRVKDRPASVETAKAKESEKSKEPEQSEDDSARVRVKKKPRS
jgi:hypothetical protein